MVVAPSTSSTRSPGAAPSGAVGDGSKFVFQVSVIVGSNTLSFAAIPAWQRKTLYSVGTVVQSDGGAYVALPYNNWTALTYYPAGSMVSNSGSSFVAISPGASGSTTGPTGDSPNISDGVTGLVWSFSASSQISGDTNPSGVDPFIVDGGVIWAYIGPAGTPSFASTDIGKIITVARQDVYGGFSPWWSDAHTYDGHATITAVSSSSSVTVDVNASATPPYLGTDFSNQSWPYSGTPSIVMWGTDNSTFFNSALLAGSVVNVPEGNFCFGSQLVMPSNTAIIGLGQGSILMPCGVLDSAPQSNIVPLIVNSAMVREFGYFTGPMGQNNAMNLLNQFGDSNITVSDLAIDISASGIAFGGLTTRMFLLNNGLFTNIRIFGSPMNGYEAPNFTACRNITVTQNVYDNVTNGFTPWGGCVGLTCSYNQLQVPFNGGPNVTYGTGQWSGIQINVMGTYLNDAQYSSDILIAFNTIRISGALIPSNKTLGICLFPDGVNSACSALQIIGNKILCTNLNNSGIVVVGAAQGTTIYDNYLENSDGGGLSPINIAPDSANISSYSVIVGTASAPTVPGSTTLNFSPTPFNVVAGGAVVDTSSPSVIPPNTHVVSNTSSSVLMSAGAIGAGVSMSDSISFGPYLTGVTPQTGSSLMTAHWIGHGYLQLNATVAQGYFSPSSGPVVGGISLNGYYPITSVLGPNDFVFDAGSPSVNSSMVAWNGAFAVISVFPVATGISRNVMVDCASYAVGLISCTSIACSASDNHVTLSSQSKPNYLSLIEWNSVTPAHPGLITNNIGAAGVGALPGGFSGNNRVCWNTSIAVPIVLDPDDADGALRVASGSFDVPTAVTGDSSLAAANTEWVQGNTISFSNGGFTPSLNIGGSSSGVTYAVQTGVYWRIGKICYFNAYLVITGKGSNVGSVTISGLPFAAAPSIPTAQSVDIPYYGLSGLVGDPAARIYSSQSTIGLFTNHQGSAASLTDANFNPTCFIGISGFYPTT